jgi:hypothetical protein
VWVASWISLAGIIAVAATETVVVRDPMKSYPFSLSEQPLNVEQRQMYGAMMTLRRALSSYKLREGGVPARVDDLLKSPSGAWFTPRNPYNGQPARVRMVPAVPAEVGDLILMVPPSRNANWAGMELRAYAKGLPGELPYFYHFVPRSRVPEEVREAYSSQAVRLKGLTEQERQVESYAAVLEACANKANETKVPGYKEVFGGIASLADLRAAWWECDPSVITNPFTGKPVREVPVTAPSPGEVTFLPVQLDLDVTQRYKGSLADRPESYPRGVVIIGWTANLKPVDWARLSFANRFRPSDLDPLPVSILKQLLPD